MMAARRAMRDLRMRGGETFDFSSSLHRCSVAGCCCEHLHLRYCLIILGYSILRRSSHRRNPSSKVGFLKNENGSGEGRTCYTAWQFDLGRTDV